MRTLLNSVNVQHIVILLLILGTYTLFTQLRYQEHDSNLLHNSNFVDGSNSWTSSSDCGKLKYDINLIQLENWDNPCNIFLRQHLPIPHNATLLMLTAEIYTRAVSQGQRSWHSARLSFVGVDNNNKRMWHHNPHAIKLPLNSISWRHVSQVFTIPPDAVELVVGLEILETTGKLSVRNIRLTKVFENSWFPQAVNTLLIFWSLTAVWLIKKNFQLFHSRKMQGLFLITCVIIAIGCTIPNSAQDQILSQAKDAMAKINILLAQSFGWSLPHLDPKNQFFNLIFSPDVLGHFILFIILAFILRIGRPHDKFFTQFFNLILFAACTETWQFFLVDRQPAITDWAIDLSGILIGLLLAGFINFWRFRKNV